MNRLEELAIAIADHAARADIEIYARHVPADNGNGVYDIAKPSSDFYDDEWPMIVSRAAQYIELRGDALPFFMRRNGNVVWFEERAA